MAREQDTVGGDYTPTYGRLASSGPPTPTSRSGQILNIAAGRELHNLLFVTNPHALAANIGQAESELVLRSLGEHGCLTYSDVPSASELDKVSKAVRLELQHRSDIKGVVIIGGYDVIPAQRLDCLPQALREAIGYNDDPDNFIVWSDELYGDIDGDSLPEIPVSRIPDGRSSRLVFAALQADNVPRQNQRIGVRNTARPFSEGVYQLLPGGDRMLVSEPAVYNQTPEVQLGADSIYLMLHGDFVDGSRFWGEGTPANAEAVNVGNISERTGRVVFAGCCWGALTVDTPAGRVVPGRSFGPKTPESSMALSFLLRGALAFIGCTGSHYSPLVPPYRYYGGPMHRAFWQRYVDSAMPAPALFDAKIDYLRGIPHEQKGLLALGVELKTLRQYTCLGLGW